nr:MAG TPA: hypothetical protein [Caudoviricetes sp.]
MWKHKNFINLQLCAGPIPFPVTVNGTKVYIKRLSDSGATGEETWSYNASINTDKYTISSNTVVWNDGTILQYNGVDVLPTDTIYVDVQYTTRTSTPQPTLTFKHFYDAGTIGTGTYKFRHYSQQEPSSGETWVLNDSLTLTYNTFSVDFTANNSSYTEMWMSDRELAYGDSSNVVYATKGGWIDEANKTLVFATPPTGDLLTWLQANGTKQGGGSNVVTLSNANILAPMTTSMLSVTRGTFNTTAEPTFYTTNNDADKVIVGSKGYPLIEKINDANATEIVTANQFFETFGITETNKGTTITGNWEFVCGFGGRLTTTQGTNGGDFEVWGTNEDGFENIKELGEIEDVLFVVYDTETDTAAVYELDEYNGRLGTFKVSAEVGYNKITSFATRVIE